MTTRAASPRRIDFQGGGPFYSELRSRVREVVEEPGQARRATVRMYSKSAFMVLWVVASFILINAYGLCSTYGHVGFG